VTTPLEDTTMQDTCRDLLGEYQALADLCDTLTLTQAQ